MLHLALSTFLLFLSLGLRRFVTAQNCISASCGGFQATVTSCDAAVGTNAPDATFIGCVCQAPVLFDNDLQTCYSCVQSLGNQTLLNEVQGFLNICVTYQSISTTTPSTFISIASLLHG
jgi:hypothetical protein